MWIELELDRLHLSAQRPKRPLAWPSAAEVDLVRSLGFVEPVTVRSIPGSSPTCYEIVSGEKQWLTAQRADLPTITAWVRDDLTDDTIRRLQQLSANNRLLNPIQEAQALQQQVQKGLSVTRAGAAMGRTRTAASHRLRLLRLEPIIQQWIVEGILSVGHAKPLIGLEPKRQVDLARRIQREQLSVRQVEALMHRIRRHPTCSTQIDGEADDRNPDHLRFENRLSEQLGVPVTVEYSKEGSGRLILAFSDLEILDGLLERFGYQDDVG